MEWIRTMKHEWENRIASFVRRCGITIFNSGGKSSHGTNETANKVSGGGTATSRIQKRKTRHNKHSFEYDKENPNRKERVPVLTSEQQEIKL